MNHSPLVKRDGFLPQEVAAKYEYAQETLLSYWHQLKLELAIMPESPLIDTIQGFIAKYDASADSRASEAFAGDIQPITQQVSLKAQKKFQEQNP